MTLAERFWRKVKKTDGCWLWTGAKDPDGYGYIGVSAGRCRRAHRVAWELTHGPIPPGKHVLHDCPGGDNPACVRHLWLGTHADNMADMGRKGRVKTRNHPLAKLTGRELAEIRRRRDEPKAALALEYGVSREQVRRIMNWMRGKD